METAVVCSGRNRPQDSKANGSPNLGIGSCRRYWRSTACFLTGVDLVGGHRSGEDGGQCAYQRRAGRLGSGGTAAGGQDGPYVGYPPTPELHRPPHRRQHPVRRTVCGTPPRVSKHSASRPNVVAAFSSVANRTNGNRDQASIAQNNPTLPVNPSR
jgi:hypothetical protein